MFQEKYNEYLSFFEKTLSKKMSELSADAPETIKESMKYAIMDGGKRIRPILCFATNEILGGTFSNVSEFALAIEMIHSYSLVHDDLPAMDNDDYRRGKLSTHKKFGEANGILAGDALLTFAFETVLNKKDFTENDCGALKILAEYAGYSGMVCGQVLDLENEKNESISEDILIKIYENKTAKLILAPILIASIKNNSAYYKDLYDFGYNLGLLFQITDDIMDETGSLSQIGKTPHKDVNSGKSTSVKLFGIEGAKDKEKNYYLLAKNSLAKIPNSDFLLELLNKIYIRKS